MRFKNVNSSPADFGSSLISGCLTFACAWHSPWLIIADRSSSRLAMVSCRHNILRPRARPRQRLPVSTAQRWLASCRLHILLSSENKFHRHCPHETLSTPASAVNRTVKMGGKGHRGEDILFGMKSSCVTLLSH